MNMSRAAFRLMPLPAVMCGLLALSGCQLVGGAIENYKRDSTHMIEAEYTGLAGRSFAVVVVADRGMEMENPGLTDYLTRTITDRLANTANVPKAGAFAPSDQVLKYVYNNPSWPIKPRTALAADLGGVQRIVHVELSEFRLNEPGNSYEWDGVATARLSIIEVDGARPDDFAFERMISVKFPGKKGMGPNDMTRSTVSTALAYRLVDRTTWLLYNHEEPYYPEY